MRVHAGIPALFSEGCRGCNAALIERCWPLESLSLLSRSAAPAAEQGAQGRKRSIALFLFAFWHRFQRVTRRKTVVFLADRNRGR